MGGVGVGVEGEVGSTAHVVEGLLPGVPYVFRVAAGNKIGYGSFSKPSPPVTMTVDRGGCGHPLVGVAGS